jgi:hypothetical protein
VAAALWAGRGTPVAAPAPTAAATLPSGPAAPLVAPEGAAAVARVAPVASASPAVPAVPAPQQAPPASARNVPDFALRREALLQPAPRLTEAALAALKANGRVVGIYRICAGEDGSVVFASVVQGFAPADAEVLAALRTWKYKPQPVPLCAQVSVFLEAP